jgi:hypothetical protein
MAKDGNCPSGTRAGPDRGRPTTVASDSGNVTSGFAGPSEASVSYLVRVDEAASITGLPASLIRKSFMAEAKRPTNIPAPPPHKRIGRAVYILRDQLAAWVDSIDEPSGPRLGRGRRGRPTVAERIKRRAHLAAFDVCTPRAKGD